ncbi:valine N-monooxygenase 1-like [Jatropha curcas]|uniref:valine N-monooxygenase 1-like n=1 Tax=Jatropha curcas TaxID=180498 RepID=UPI001895BFBA|nr:valine N-monooxygenase 1-like [Jatropha curcas]
MVFNKRFFGKGKKNGGPGFEEAQHVDALFRILDLDYSFSFCLSDYLPCSEGFDLGGREKIIKEANGIIGKYHDPIIEDRVQQWKDGTKKEEEDLLDVLITLKDDNGNPLPSTYEIKAQITVILTFLSFFYLVK